MKQILMLIAIAFTAPSAWASSCHTDASLTKAEFNVSTKNFTQAVDKVSRTLTQDQDNLEALKGGTIHSSVSGKMVTVVPVDDLRTARTEMIGDYVVLYDFKTREPVEVRWYEGGVKYVRYNPAQTPCATDMVPWAYNSLY